MTTKKIETKIETNLSENTESVGATSRSPLPDPSIPNQSDFQSDRRATARVARTTNSAESVAQSNTEPVGATSRSPVPDPPVQIPFISSEPGQSAPFAQRSVGDLLTGACSQAGINPKTLLDWAIKVNRVILINSRGEKISIQWPPA